MENLLHILTELKMEEPNKQATLLLTEEMKEAIEDLTKETLKLLQQHYYLL